MEFVVNLFQSFDSAFTIVHSARPGAHLFPVPVGRFSILTEGKVCSRYSILARGLCLDLLVEDLLVGSPYAEDYAWH